MSDLSHEKTAIVITAYGCNSSGESVRKKTSNTEVSYEEIKSKKTTWRASQVKILNGYAALENSMTDGTQKGLRKY